MISDFQSLPLVVPILDLFAPFFARKVVKSRPWGSHLAPQGLPWSHLGLSFVLLGRSWDAFCLKKSVLGPPGANLFIYHLRFN